MGTEASGKEDSDKGDEKKKDSGDDTNPSTKTSDPSHGMIKTAEVDSVIDKMNPLNEMFERILKHMDKVIPTQGDSGATATEPENKTTKDESEDKDGNPDNVDDEKDP